MDGGAWWATTVHGVAKVGHDRATKQQKMSNVKQLI